MNWLTISLYFTVGVLCTISLWIGFTQAPKVHTRGYVLGGCLVCLFLWPLLLLVGVIEETAKWHKKVTDWLGEPFE